MGNCPQWLLEMGEASMTEEQAIKLICKLYIENGSCSLGDAEKEMLKRIVDDSKDLGELLIAVALSKLF